MDEKKSLEQLNREMRDAETDPFTVRRYAQFADLMTTPPRRVLDVGCSTGRGGRVIRQRFPGVTLDGVDLVPEHVATMAPGVYDHLSGGFIQDLDAEPGTYDAILMGEVIEHVPLDALDVVLEAVGRLLSPGGVLLLTTPNPHYVLLRVRAQRTMLGGAHVSAHCPEALRQYLGYKGMRVATLKGTGRWSTIIGGRWPLPLYGSYLMAVHPTQ